jgi:thioredoxin 1
MLKLPKDRSPEAFLEILPIDRPALVDFFATWCEPCAFLDEILIELEQKLGERVLIVKADVDEQQLLTTHYSVRSVPTLMIFSKGELKWRMAGFKMGAELEAELNPWLL